MKEYYGNYLGLCINNDDPEKRGRVQVFVPHIMPALFENWNDAGEDIKLVCVGDNLPDTLPSPVVDKLKKILPWAESASPILGTSAPGNLMGTPSYSQEGGSGSYNLSPVPDAEGYAGGVGGVTAGALGAGATGDTSQSALIAKAIANKNLYEPGGKSLSFASSQGKCGIGSRRIAGALLGSRYFSQGLSIGGDSRASSTTLGRGNNYFQRSGLYSAPTAASSSYITDRSQWRIGDVVSCAGGKQGNGHVQTYIGNGQWVSDFPQGSKILTSPLYNNFTLHRLNDKGLAQLQGAGTVNNFATSGGTSATGTTTAGSGYETPSTSGQVAAASPHQSQVPIGSSTSNPSRYGSIADPNVQGGGGTLSVPGVGQVSGSSSSSGISPGAIEYAMRTAAAETGAGIRPGNETAKYINNINNTIAMSQGIKNGYEVRGVSFSRINQIAGEIKSKGLLNKSLLDIGYTQHNANDMRAYGLRNYGSYKDQILSLATHVQNQANKNPAFASLLANRNFSAAEAMNGGKIVPGWNNSIYKNSHLSNKAALTNLISTKYGGNVEAALADLSTKYPDTPSLDAMLAGTTSESIPEGDLAPAAELAAADASQLPDSQMVQNPDPHGTTAVMDINNMAGGMFSYPAAGALIWCFFREGNPLYPVYFAASYGQREWQSAYRYDVASPAQDGVGYKPAATPDSPVISVGGRWNIGKVGALAWTDEMDPNDPTKNQKSLMLAGHDGSNMFFNEGYHQIFSKFDRRDQVEGDRWETTLGQKEEWVQGDSNTVVMGDMFLKVGNVGPEAVEAVEKIQSIIKESMQPLTEPRDCSEAASGSSTTKSKSSFKKKAEANAVKGPESSTLTSSALTDTNNITTPNLPGIPQAAPAPQVTPTSPAAVNSTSTAVNPAVNNPFAQGSAPNSNVKFVPSSFPTGNLKVTPL